LLVLFLFRTLSITSSLDDDADGNSLLHVASKAGKLEVVKALVEFQRTNSTSSLSVADAHGEDALEAQQLRDSAKGVDARQSSDGIASDVSGGGCDAATLNVVKSPVSDIQDVNAPSIGLDLDINKGNNDGFTAVHLAAEAGHVEVVTYLVSEGADLGIKSTSGGRSPLYSACLNGHLNVASYLIGVSQM
jgi:ankyrin repeat protein